MESDQFKSLSGQLKALVEAKKDFPQKLQKSLVSKCSKVENQFQFIVELFNEGVLCEGSNDVVMLLQMAVTIGYSKGADGISGMLRALESSGNFQLISVLQTWATGDIQNETDDDGGPSELNEGTSGLQFPPRKKPRRNETSAIELNSTGAKLMDKIKAHVDENGFMEQLEAFLLSIASQILHAKEFCASLLQQNVPAENVVTTVTRLKTPSVTHRATGPRLQQELMEIVKAIKAACSKKAIKALVLALQSSSNEQILVEIFSWIESYQVRKKKSPMSIENLGNKPMPTAIGLFAATSTGLISLDLQTLEATALTSESTLAVAVNHNLKKVYWSEVYENSRIMRSNFNGSAKEMIVPQQGKSIYTLSIDESSENVYFALAFSNEVKVCNALGKNCIPVISNSSSINHLIDIVLDSVKGVMYLGNRGPFAHSLIRANLDGSNAAIISTGFKDLRGITLDQSSNDILYWADSWEHAIGTVDADGGNKRILVKLEGSTGPWGIQVDIKNFYFSNFNSRSIQCVNRDSGKELTTIFDSTGFVYHLALLNAPVKQS